MRKNSMKKPFMDHLKELNYRILVSLIFISLIAIVVYIRYSFFVNLLLEPLINAGYDESNIFALTIYEGFQVKLENTFWIAIIITFPLVLLTVGYFIKPALDISTINFFLYFIFFTLLFYLGIGTSLSIAHVGIEFLLSFNENEIILRSQNYFQFITRVSLLFGVSFQLPLIVLFLLNKGIIKVNNLTKKRPEMFILILIFSAVITPTGDPVSLFIFTIPMYLLIEIMIFIHKKSNREF
jgi:sec-independent protein translocase protein TatC